MNGPAQTWEYRTLSWEASDWEASDAELSVLGREGWELVGVSDTPGATRLYFKRPGLDFRERVTLDQKRRYYALWGHPVAEESGRA